MDDKDLVVIDFPIDDESLTQFLAFRFTKKKKWWAGKRKKTPLRILRNTTVWMDLEKTIVWANITNLLADLDYYGLVADMGEYKLAKVYDKPELWVDVNDVDVKG